MNTAMSPSELEALGERLKHALLRLSPWLQVQVRCVIKQGDLLILIEHLLHIEPDPQQTFVELKRSLLESSDELFKSGFVQRATGSSAWLSVHAYLRIVGYQQPYTSQSFVLEPPTPIAEFDLPMAAPEAELSPVIVEIEAIEREEAAEATQSQFYFEPCAEPEPIAVSQSIVEPDVEPENLEVEVPLVEEPQEEREPTAAIAAAYFEPVVDSPSVEDAIVAAPIQASADEAGSELAVQVAQDIVQDRVQDRVQEEPLAELPELETPELETVEIITLEASQPEPIESAIVEEFIDAEDLFQESTEAPTESAIVENPLFEDSVEESIEATISAPTPIEAFLQFEEISASQDFVAELEFIELQELGVEELEEAIPETNFEEWIANFASVEPIEPEAPEPLAAIVEAPPEPEVVEAALEEPIATSEVAEPIAVQEPPIFLPSETAEPQASQPEVAESLLPLAAEAPIVKPEPPEAPEEELTPPALPQRPLVKPFKSRFSSSTLMVGGAVGLFALVSATYVVTRPCVLGRCELLQTAQQLDQQATQTIAKTDSALAVVEAYNQLTQASYLVSTIPAWSGHYQDAQALQSTYEDKSKVVGQVVKALKQANTAAQKSQKPPHPLPQWRQIQWTWREAIAILEKVPSDSLASSLAQKKLAEYKLNLTNTDRRVLIEQNAQDKITTARNTAEIAGDRSGIAKSSDNWQQVYLTWEAAISLLQQIPQGTMAHAEAQQLLAIYQPQKAEADNRRNQENVSLGSYQQAVSFAKQAGTWEQRSQWSEAVAAWQDAITNMQQIPQGTTYYTQAQSQINEYQTALAQAEQTLRRSTAMQTVKPDLDRACGETPQVCTYTLSADAVRVQITEQYDRAVEKAIASAQIQGSFSARTEVVSQVDELLRNLADIGKSAQVPIELYNSNGSLFGTYAADASGYVAR